MGLALKSKRRGGKEKNNYFAEEESNCKFHYIAGYTSNGAAFGITWEEALKEGLIEVEDFNKHSDEFEEDVF